MRSINLHFTYLLICRGRTKSCLGHWILKYGTKWPYIVLMCYSHSISSPHWLYLQIPPWHRLRIRILRFLKFPKIHEFLRILKRSILKFIKFKLSHSSPPNSDKLFVAKAALNFWIKLSSVMSTIQDSLARQQFSKIASSILQSLRIACSVTVFQNRRPARCSYSTVASVQSTAEK